MTRNGSFYFPDEWRHKWERFQQIAKREGKNSSILLREYIEKYIDEHDPGNPQARITSYFEGEQKDIATIEGKIREKFRTKQECRYTEILEQCYQGIENKKIAQTMAERITKWLQTRKTKIWK